ncbi:hypothetical protein SLEP1_g50684 [Rubroshorea leprosula]|uniref:Vacuolar protein sorting-associated protein Ist1 n=1 Tax=Rubroshorea leprosula TaxID=152421 RepID=A0AAV5M408_9ROSI|nr:hypothetical protein SLEP1_g50684 [Rubroshorea leprosula]
MFNGILKPKFYTKCKSAIKYTKLRIEMIMRKRNASQKILKNDVVYLLKHGHDYEAYGRTEALLIEQKKTDCYQLVDQFCDCIQKNLSLMQKERECPKDCREAVASLIYAAARFADLTELCDLRSQFTEKYGNALESFVNEEFAVQLRAEPPTKDMRLQLMHDIAEEFSLEWDPKALEQKLFKPPPPEQVETRHNPSNDSDTGYRWHKSKNDDFQRKGNHDEVNRLSQNKEYTKPKGNGRSLGSFRSNKGADIKNNLYGSSDDEVTEISRSISSDQDSSQTSSSSFGSASEDEEKRKPFDYRSIPAPYVRTNVAKEVSTTESRKQRVGADEKVRSKQDDSVVDTKPNPRSVRRRPSRLSDRDNLSSVDDDDAVPREARRTMPSKITEDEEEKMIDGLPMRYSNKKSPYEPSNSWKANLKAPAKQRAEDTEDATTSRNTKTVNLGSVPIRVFSLPTDSTTSDGRRKENARSTSLQPDMQRSHVHPKLPDYDDLASRLAALRGL